MYKKIIFTVLFILVLGVAYYVISPIFKNTKLNEPAPKNTSGEMSDNNSKPLSSSTSTDNKITSEMVQKEVALKLEATTPIKGTSGHPASGEVKIITSGDVKIVRYENFKTINGPDLYVYLSKDLQAKEFVNLGKLKATEGNINYEVYKEINLKDYPYIIVWCKAFGVLFNSADISKLVQ
jgi:hypothetical protein